MARPDESVVDGSKARPKDLPSVDRLLRLPAVAALVHEHGHACVAGEVRALVEDLRRRVLEGGLERAGLAEPALAVTVAGRVAARLAPRMRTVVNA